MNRRTSICLLLPAMALALSSGCASIVTGTTQEMTFNSNPDGALVTVNGREVGKTPVVIQMKKGSPVPLTFSKAGYKTASFQMDTELNGWFWGNIVCGGLLGSSTDGFSGAMHKYAPAQYMATLTPEEGGSTPIERQPSLTENQKIKDFVVISYSQLQGDLARGKGEYLSSLISMLNVAEAERDDTVKKLKALSLAYPVIPDFANRVNDLSRPADAPAAAPVTH